MDFSFKDYENLIRLIIDNGYSICDYHDYSKSKKCVILRHDIDQSIDKAYKLACIESELGVSSTWFVLLRTDFYNVASQKSLKLINAMQNQGHEIGLHFDEMAYKDRDDIVNNIVKEADILSHIIEAPVTTVSMHRPSKETLEADYTIPNIINSYGKLFFNEFKYLSDSRRYWREPVESIVESGRYKRLHILTHAFWYNTCTKEMDTIIRDYINNAKFERYESMKNNIRDLESVLKVEELI